MEIASLVVGVLGLIVAAWALLYGKQSRDIARDGSDNAAITLTGRLNWP